MLAPLTLWLCIGLFSAPSLEGQEPLGRSIPGQGTKIWIGPGSISVPEDLTLLVRKGNQYGALRFSGIKPGPEQSTGSAEYESVFQADGSGSFSKANVIARKGKVHQKPLVGIGRMSFQTGPTTLRIGPFKFYYRYPNWVYMYPAGELEGDYGFEFSIVRSRDFQSIDPIKLALKWHRCNRDSSTEDLIP